MQTLFIFLALLLVQLQDTPPLAQVQLVSNRRLHTEPAYSAPVSGGVRRGTVVLLYEIEDRWGRTPDGWVSLRGMTPQPALVHLGASLRRDVPLRPSWDAETPWGTLKRGTPAGIAAIFHGDALVYSADAAGWVDLERITITEPSSDVVDFLEQRAFVKVESAALFDTPQESASPQAVLLLGKEVTILHSSDSGWALLRSNHLYGWSRLENFDLVLAAQARGQMNAGPINFRRTPSPSGAIMTVLDYLAGVLILGRSADSEWLYVRARGLDGWVAAPYVDFDRAINDLPIIQGNN